MNTEIKGLTRRFGRTTAVAGVLELRAVSKVYGTGAAEVHALRGGQLVGQRR